MTKPSHCNPARTTSGTSFTTSSWLPGCRHPPQRADRQRRALHPRQPARRRGETRPASRRPCWCSWTPSRRKQAPPPRSPSTN